MLKVFRILYKQNLTLTVQGAAQQRRACRAFISSSSGTQPFVSVIMTESFAGRQTRRLLCLGDLGSQTALTKATWLGLLGLAEGTQFSHASMRIIRKRHAAHRNRGGVVPQATRAGVRGHRFGMSVLQSKCASFTHLHSLPPSVLACVCSVLRLNVYWAANPAVGAYQVQSVTEGIMAPTETGICSMSQFCSGLCNVCLRVCVHCCATVCPLINFCHTLPYFPSPFSPSSPRSPTLSLFHPASPSILLSFALLATSDCAWHFSHNPLAPGS